MSPLSLKTYISRDTAQPVNSYFLVMLLIVGVLSSLGCSPKYVKLDQQELGRLKEERLIQVVHYEPPSLGLRTPGAALAGGMFGAVGGAVAGVAMLSAGDQMRQDYQVQNPSLLLKKKFLSSLSQDLELKNIQIVDEPLKSDDIAEIKNKLTQSSVLDFQTMWWELFYYPTDWSHYRMSYTGRARLVRLAESEVVWESHCSFQGNDPKTSPTLDELRANNGEILKAKLDEATAACAETLLAAFWGKERDRN